MKQFIFSRYPYKLNLTLEIIIIIIFQQMQALRLLFGSEHNVEITAAR